MAVLRSPVYPYQSIIQSLRFLSQYCHLQWQKEDKSSDDKVQSLLSRLRHLSHLCPCSLSDPLLLCSSFRLTCCLHSLLYRFNKAVLLRCTFRPWQPLLNVHPEPLLPIQIVFLQVLSLHQPPPLLLQPVCQILSTALRKQARGRHWLHSHSGDASLDVSCMLLQVCNSLEHNRDLIVRWKSFLSSKLRLGCLIWQQDVQTEI